MNTPDLSRPTAPHAEWAVRPERSNQAMLRLMTWISLRLGRAPARVVLAGISFYFLLFAPAAKAASRAYLRRALEREPSFADLYRHFHSFASTIHDRVFMLNARFDLFEVEVHGEDVIQDVLAAGRGAILMGAHMGSFEVLRAIGRRRPGMRVAMVMFEDNARKINAALRAINPAAQQDIVALGHADSMLKVHELIEGGSVVGMLADRCLNHDSTRPVPFLGEPAEFPVGPFRMAAILRRPVLFMVGLYGGGNRYDIHFETLADFSTVPAGAREAAVQAAIARYAQLLEAHCRTAPYNWFNFFDFWQPAPPTPEAHPVPPHA